MNNFNSRQRKLIYAGIILVLLIPIVLLGAPNSEDVDPDNKSAVSGGMLARMRVEYDLGESTLGEIDPSSAAMNLVLLGLRGPAAGVLHLQALDYQEKKDWAKLKATVDSIIKLQPHYVEIWKFQGWNLSFNVSREWDRVADRFYWVKEGIKFLQLGTQRNQTARGLFHDVGDFTGRKFGGSDEKRFFRKMFLVDPDTKQFEGGADGEINPDNVDNYLVAADWFRRANVVETKYPAKTPVIFRQGPARALFEYAKALQDDGIGDGEDFDEEDYKETNRAAWDEAYREWTEVYGNYEFLGLNDVKYKMNCTDAELENLARENGVTIETQRSVWQQNVRMTNFKFWMEIADCERDPETVDAHVAILKGKQAYAKGLISNRLENGEELPSEAQLEFEKGIAGIASMLEKYPNLSDHDDYIEEGLLSVYYWTQIFQYNGKEPPEDHPLAKLAEEHQRRQFDIQRRFQLENRGDL